MVETAHPITDYAQARISDRVRFSYQNREWEGTIAQKGKRYAYVVCENQQEFRVPYRRLYKISGRTALPVHIHQEQQRAQFHPGDKIRFETRGAVQYGVIARTNPKTAHVVGETGEEYRVPYAMLHPIQGAACGQHTARGYEELEAVADVARTLLTRHQLSHWGFQFDRGTKRAGACHYGKRLITLSYEFARHAPQDEIQDTILHEIAHAIVGQKHNHDAVWQAKARQIGCSGQRCHTLQFVPPRYIMKCARGCWIATAERRRRDVICKRCQAEVIYLTYTQDRWDYWHRESSQPKA